MNFECLANELILEIFDYFNGIQLVRLFYGLNRRFNKLLHNYFHHHCLDFRSISKKDFDFICQEIVPSISEHIDSICLSDDDETPNEIQEFLSYGFRLGNFSRLTNFSLLSVNSIEFLSEILFQTPQLKSLEIRAYCSGEKGNQYELLIDWIWSLSQLECCYLEIIFPDDDRPLSTKIISKSIRNLSIEGESFSFESFVGLCRSTPNLNSLRISIKDSTEDQQIYSSTISSLTKFDVQFQGSLELLENLLFHLPNLIDLKIENNFLYVSGDQWEKLIHFRMKQFQMLMNFKFAIGVNPEEEINEILQSFQRQFWINETRQWFVRCDFHSEERNVSVYTLPFAFKMMKTTHNNRSRSTLSNTNQFNDYHHVKTLTFNDAFATFASENSRQFPSIESLEVSYPFHSELKKVLTKFRRLKSLELMSNGQIEENDQHINELKSFIDQAVRLYSLSTDFLTLSRLPTVDSSIRRLNLITHDGHFYGFECLNLIKSIFHDRCEVLLINVENRNVILRLIEHFHSLRTLIFQCQDDRWGENQDLSIIDDPLLDWLRSNLPKHYSISRDCTEPSAIRIWLG